MPEFWWTLEPDATPQQRRLHKAKFNRWVKDQAARVARQRAILERPTRGVRGRVIKAMLARAWELLDAGETEAADALLEFCPADQAEALRREFFDEE